MNNIFLDKSDNTPKVIMDRKEHFIEFEGKSYTPKIHFPFIVILQNG